MCKILCIPKVKDVEKAKLFTRQLASIYVKNQTHGSGVAFVSNGNINVEKWLNVDETFSTLLSSKELQSLQAMYDPYVNILTEYETHGESFASSQSIDSILFHARVATSPKVIENTHPFTLFDNENKVRTALIHNGVVDEKRLQLITSSCDSEGILNEYDKLQVQNNIKNIAEMAKNVVGSYAVGILSKSNEGIVMDVIKNEHARLKAMHVKEISDSLIFATDRDDVIETCSKISFAKPPVFDVLDNVILRHSVGTGALIDVEHFENQETHNHHWVNINTIGECSDPYFHRRRKRNKKGNFGF